ncbi:MAG: LysR family transcriptional regulator [Pseudomonas sp.]|nr:LysR family transcriptional regulator [Pseudomonas sp.]
MLNRMEMLRIFTVAAHTNNFREAASRLGVSPQSVTRAIKELEELFGQLLFHRSTRQVQITAFGARLAGQAQQTLSSFDELFQHNVQQPIHDLAGRVRITAPQAVGRRFVMPVLGELMSEYPQIDFDLRLSDAMTDAVDAQIDIGVRIGFIRDRRYIARAVAHIPLLVVATPELLARSGTPDRLDALHTLPTSTLVDRGSGRPWPWYFANDRHLQPAKPSFTTDDQEVELDAVLGGLAIGQLPSYLVLPALRNGTLRSLLDEHRPPPWELFIYRPQRGPVAPRVRLVYDRLSERLADPALLPSEA